MIRIVGSKFITSAVKPSSYPDTVWKDFAFVGRSNVGKSSMINTITNRKLLAKIANKPGKTRLINFFEIAFKAGAMSTEPNEQNPSPTTPHTEGEIPSALSPVLSETGYFGLVDLPGYGYAKVSKTEKDLWQKMINSFFQYRKQLAGAVVLVDIRHDPDPKDAVMIRMLQEMKINFMIAATKCDKIPRNKIAGQLRMFERVFEVARHPVSPSSSSFANQRGQYLTEFSSLKKIGIDNILNWIESTIFFAPAGGEQYNRVIIHDKEQNNA